VHDAPAVDSEIASTSHLLSARLAAWCAEPESTPFPFAEVVGEYQRVGKHFVGPAVLDALGTARARLAGIAGSPDRQVLATFLDVALDKRDERYDYSSYLALGLLPLPAGADPLGLQRQRDRLLSLLVTDSLRFELGGYEGKPQPLPGMPPPAGVTAKRCRLGMRALAPSLRRLGLHGLRGDDDLVRARRVCDAVATLATDPELRAVRISMLPVYTLHDEYLFLRVLQAFEVSFAFIGQHLRAAIGALDALAVEDAAARIRACAVTLRESAPLFSLLASMQVAAFRTFRTYTEGASAIQSGGYKLVESLCRRPAAYRLDSVAYRSVEPVRQGVLAGQRTVYEAFAEAAPQLGGSDLDQLTKAIGDFESAHGRWRQTHYRLAVRMLGGQSGTGYTEGTPYLKAGLELRLFPDLVPDRPGRPESDTEAEEQFG
jgi:tryptophan 2,3-dioxygenase